ncbi:uncharacterized protein SEPMUDRAFT_107106 [Sphaerulina musiva SO2202]|uniref:Uncharacterized protein n=1 Tax=Sphaerulina musiva (strain SO2202) TaxID=692275 RepID=M3CM34_SPHMS|nr:uncharacterized protein SEPMUDRAFT_107106 [Sphaerulina musiva SO2202]EMF14843.1 hypothetical protein SEPMUDRAFT_107106 [Sphaerulina musiva SO2202]
MSDPQNTAGDNRRSIGSHDSSGNMLSMVEAEQHDDPASPEFSHYATSQLNSTHDPAISPLTGNTFRSTANPSIFPSDNALPHLLPPFPDALPRPPPPGHPGWLSTFVAPRSVPRSTTSSLITSRRISENFIRYILLASDRTFESRRSNLYPADPIELPPLFRSRPSLSLPPSPPLRPLSRPSLPPPPPLRPLSRPTQPIDGRIGGTPFFSAFFSAPLNRPDGRSHGPPSHLLPREGEEDEAEGGAEVQVRRRFHEEGASVRGRVRRIPPRQLEPGHDSHSRRERDVPARGAVVRGNQARFGLADLRDDGHEHDEHDDEDEDDVQNDQDQHLESGHGNVDDDANNDEEVNSSSGLGSEEYEIHYQHGSEDESESESENDTDDDEFLYGDGGNNDDDDENSRIHLFEEIPRVRLSFEGTWEVLGGW